MMHDRSATFFLQGTADVAQAPVPLSASFVFYATGLALMGGLYWRKSSKPTSRDRFLTDRPMQGRSSSPASRLHHLLTVVLPGARASSALTAASLFLGLLTIC